MHDTISTPMAPVDSALRPLIDAIRAELLPQIRAEIRAGILADYAVKPTLSPKRLYSLRDLGRHYGVGRTQAELDIGTGKLHVVERRCRGGQMGKFVPIEEAERVYARVAGRV